MQPHTKLASRRAAKRGTVRGVFTSRASWVAAACLAMPLAVICTALAQEQRPAAATPSAQGPSAAPGLPGAPDAGATASLSGVVRTADGTGVPGATIHVVNTATNQSWVTWTDAPGKYNLPAVPPGHYRVEASEIGFAQGSGEIDVPFAGKNPPLITLNVATVAQLNAAGGGAGGRRGFGGRFGGAGGPNGSSGGAAGASKANVPAGPESGNNAGPGGTNRNGNGNGSGYGRGGYGRGRYGNGGTNGTGQPGAANGVGGASANAQNGDQSATGFDQTDLTGQPTDEQAQTVSSGDQFASNMPLGGNVTTSSDSFLLQGTVGQGATLSGPGGFGGPGSPPPGAGDIAFGTPGGFGAPPGAAFGAGPGGPGGVAGPGLVGPGGGPGGGGFGGGGGGGRFAGGGGPIFVQRGGGPGGRNGGASRLFRQRANRYRYAFYDTYNNSALNAKPFSLSGISAPKVSAYNENFGGDFNGPFKIPHLYNGAGKTNIFLNYEHRTSASAVNNYSIVPTLDERNGNFCGVSGVTLVNPYAPSSNLGCNLAGGPLALDSTAQKLLAYIAAPNLAVPTGEGQNYLLQARTPSNTDILNARILHSFNSKINLTGIYAINSARSNSIGNFADTTGTISTLGQSVTLNLNHNWSPRRVERTTVSWSRSRSRLLSSNSFGPNLESNLGIDGASQLPMNFGLPQIMFSSGTSLNDPVPSLTRNQTLLFSDAVSFYRTKHTIVVGGQIRRVELNNDASPNPRGAFSFNGGFTCGSAFPSSSGVTSCTAPLTPGGTPVVLQPAQSQAYEVADFLLGLPYQVSAQYGAPQNLYLRSWGLAAYAQDDWRVSKVFTLDYGVRWDVTTPAVEKYNHLANLALSPNLSSITVVTPGADGYPQSLIHGAYVNFGPRIGFSWVTPLKKKRTIVRGGYSIFYNVNVYNSLVRELTFQPPYDTAFSVTNPVSNFFTIENGLLAPSASSITLTNTSAVDPFYKPARAQMWTAGLEMDLSRNWVANATYTGTKGSDLDILRSPNRAPLGTATGDLQQSLAFPFATQFTYDQSGASSLYDGLQLRLVHRYTRGFSFQMQYTYSKSIDDASSIGGGSGLVEQIDGDLVAQRGLSSFDVRQAARLTGVYELPFGQRYHLAARGWTNKVFGDWRALNTVTWQTGNPLTVLMGSTDPDPSGTGAIGFSRPNQDGNPNLGVCGSTVLNFFNTAVFSPPAAGTFGDARKNNVEGPCTLNWNASMSKAFRLGSTDNQRRAEISWQVNNVLNHVNYSGVSTSFGSALFGHVTSAGAMRSMNLTLRFNF
jgi:carboxypeptidase family protein